MLNVFSTGAISQLKDSSIRSNRQWVPGQLYSGLVKSIHEDGSIEVLINTRVYQALAHKSAQPGDLLSLRLLGNEPEPHFEIVGVLRRGATQQEQAVQIQSTWQEAVSMLRQLNPGLSALAALWQRYPEELGKLSASLPALLAEIQAQGVPAAELSKPGRLRRHAMASGLFYENALDSDEAGEEDIKPLLFRLLGALQGGRQLVLDAGRAVFTERSNSSAQSLHDKGVALYSTEMAAGSGSSTLKQLLTLNIESALQQIVSGQLASMARSDDNISIWIMQLMINYQRLLLPVELELRRQANGSEQEHWGAVFSLELPRAGRIHIELAVKKPAVSIQVSCSHQILGAMLMQNSATLKKAFEKLGLELGPFECTQVDAA